MESPIRAGKSRYKGEDVMDLITATLLASLLSLSAPVYALLRLLAFENLPMPPGVEPQAMLGYGLLVVALAACFAIAALCRPSDTMPADDD